MPSIQIHQQYAQIGIETDRGQLEIRQPRPDFEIQTKPAKLETTYRKGDQVIDQSASWEALGKGTIFQFTERVADESKSIAMEGIGRRVDEGNRLAAIQNGGNPISEIAFESAFRDFKMNYEGPFYTTSVKLTYTPNRPEVHFEPGDVNITAKVNPPEINYSPGKVNIYMLQKNAVEIVPPQIDARL
ncbi:DUF6470 family protein [Paenibacillus thalictri]|uniref:DUF6470 family protein n=1 Tax=Paenibacillus thalictri TaxID=2527873 RepID=UPI0013EF2D73|nr:DUF6470 family protein [Paenibacillus thalictri]